MKKLIVTLMLATLPAWAADEAAQVKFLKQLFAEPTAQWSQLLEQNSALLDDSFFERCEARIAWDLERGHQDDALRFALVGDTAARIVGRPAHFQADLPK